MNFSINAKFHTCHEIDNSRKSDIWYDSHGYHIKENLCEKIYRNSVESCGVFMPAIN